MIIDGKKVAAGLMEKVKKEILMLGKKPGLAVILIGEDPASQIYVNIKEKKCKEAGITSYKYQFDKNISEEYILNLINELNMEKKVTGILVQLPLPSHISENKIMNAVSPAKDVDGFNPLNIGRAILGEDSLQPCAAKGIMMLLKYYNIPLKGKEAVVIGNSIIVGNPIAQMLLRENATVTICHIKTKDLAYHTKRADIIVSAVGQRNLVTAGMVKHGTVIIDVGIVKQGDKIYGDVDFENVKDKCLYITPVPGGVGPVTIACLLDNTVTACKLQ